MISKARKKKLLEDAQVFEASGRFRHLIREDLQDPQIDARLETLAEKFITGRYLFHYRRDLGEKPYADLLQFKGLSEEEAQEAITFTYLCMKIRHKRRQKLKKTTHLRVAQ